MKSPFYFITDENLTKNGVVRDCTLAIEAGSTLIQYRRKDVSTRLLFEEALEVARVCMGKATFIVNDRIDIALAVNASGVHLGQSDMPIKEARSIIGKDKIIGISATTIEEAIEAEKYGANYVGFGPIYTTTTKEDAPNAVGLSALREVVNTLNIPVVALGGITKENAADVLKAGASSICAMSATITDDVYSSVLDFVSIYESLKQS